MNKGTAECYKFSLKIPEIYGDYLKEMSWRNRTSITDYIARLIAADMEQHPEWTEEIILK